MNTKIFFILFLSIQCFSQSVDNPWQQKKGEILISPAVGYYFTDSSADSNGTAEKFGGNGSYYNINPRVYFSSGLGGNNWNIFGSIPFLIAEYESDNEKQENSSFGEIEIGVRKHLTKIKEHYLMGSLSAFIPAYKNKQTPYVGFEKYSIEGRLRLAGSFTWLGQYKNYHTAEIGARVFTSADPVQLTLFLSQGYKITPKITILGEFNLNVSMSDNGTINANNGIPLNSKYDLAKLAINVGYNFTDRFGIYVGAFHDVWNRNIAIGKGVQIFSIIRL